LHAFTSRQEARHEPLEDSSSDKAVKESANT